MRITFLSPHTGVSGGVKILFEYANRLMDRGHDVTVLSIIPKSLRDSETKDFFYTRDKPNPVKWFNLRTNLILAPTFHEQYVPDGDAVIASAWRTAYKVAEYPAVKGEKFYLIQSYETWDGPEDLVDATWTLPLRKLVIAGWLKELAEKRFHLKTGPVLTNAIDFSEFYCRKKRWNIRKRVGMLFHRRSWKGVKDAGKAFLMAKERHPEIQLVMFGARPDPEWTHVEYEWHYRPSIEKLRNIYCSCDIWLCGSLVEGFALPPAEAMACRCTLVATDIGGVRDYAIHDRTALLSPPGDPEALARNLIRVLENEHELKRLSEAGHTMIRTFTWEKAVKRFEGELMKAELRYK